MQIKLIQILKLEIKFLKSSQIDFGRIAAQSAKQVISTRVREAEKSTIRRFYRQTRSDLSGIIKRLEYGNGTIDLGKAEGVIKKDELIPREILKLAIESKHIVTK